MCCYKLRVWRIMEISYRLSTACIEMKSAGTLKVSKKISAAFSLFLLGLSGASVSKTGCCKGHRTQGQRIRMGLWQQARQRGGAHLFRERLQLLLGVNVLPDPLHVIPVVHDSMFHGISYRQQTPVFLKGHTWWDTGYSPTEWLEKIINYILLKTLTLFWIRCIHFSVFKGWINPNSRLVREKAKQTQKPHYVPNYSRSKYLNWTNLCRLVSHDRELMCKVECVFVTSALGPIKRSPSRAPAITRTCLGRPTLVNTNTWKKVIGRYEILIRYDTNRQFR